MLMQRTSVLLTAPGDNLEGLGDDISLARKQGLYTAFTRRRVVFNMDGWRYAQRAAEKRWGVSITFYETGHDPIKRVYQSETLNGNVATIWLREIEKDPTYADTLVRELQDVIVLQKKLVATVPDIPLDTEGVTQALKLYLDYWIQFFELGFVWFAIDPLKARTDEEILKSWAGEISGRDELLEKVYRPMSLPVSSVEQRELLKMVPLKASEQERAIKDHWLKYRHLALHNIDDTYFDLGYYRNRVRGFVDPLEYRKQEEILQGATSEINEANKILSAFPVALNLKKRIELIRWFMYLRTESVDHLMQVNSVYKPIFEFLARTWGISPEEALNMTYNEIFDSLDQGGLAVPRTNLEERTKNGYAYFIGSTREALVIGEDIDRLEKMCFPEKDEREVSEFLGQAAFPGKIQGKVRVISDRRHADELQPGEILVTAMTSPDFVPAMKISLGIITDEGGILCHAAIMSRELRKPCIIGTKIATQILHDGDLVEVDADHGVVRVLERS